MDKAYPSRVNWENLPSRKTPINETNLNKGDSALRIIDDRVIELDTLKSDKETTDKHVKDITLDKTTGVITIYWENGQTRRYDTPLEKLATNFDYDPETMELVLYDVDGSELGRVDLSELILTHKFIDNDNFAWSTQIVSTEDKTDPQNVKIHKTLQVSLTLKKNSITDKQMQPNYLADITKQAQAAEASMEQAGDFADNAEYSAKLAQSYAKGGMGIRANENTDNALVYMQNARTFANNSSGSAAESAESASNSAASEENALAYRNLSEAYAKGTIGGEAVNSEHEAYQNNSYYYSQLADNSAQSANQSSITSTEQSFISMTKAQEALESANRAKQSAQEAYNYADNSNMYAQQSAQQADRARTNAQSAQQAVTDASEQAKLAQSYAVGTGGEVREGDATDNAEYYSRKAAGSASTAQSILGDIESAGDDAVQRVLDALDEDSPAFHINYDTGNLEYDGGRFVFDIDYTTGNLLWGLAV